MYTRHERKSDSDEISKAVYAAFLNHPQHAPGSLPREHRLVDALRAAGALSLSLVAEDGGAVIGHIAFSDVLIDARQVSGYGIGVHAVSPSSAIPDITPGSGLRRTRHG